MRYSDENVTNCNSKLTLLTLFLNVLLIFTYLFVLYFGKKFIITEYSVYLWGD